MTYDQALREMEAGRPVRRANWHHECRAVAERESWYFGDQNESDDYDLAMKRNFPDVWLPIPSLKP